MVCLKLQTEIVSHRNEEHPMEDVLYPTSDISSPKDVSTSEEVLTETLSEAAEASQAPTTLAIPEEIELDEFGEELIIEDFTIDGICGVY